MEVLFLALERSVESVRTVSIALGAIVLSVAFVTFMIKAITPQEYLSGCMKVFVFAGLCCCSTGIFELAQNFGLAVATQIEPTLTKDPFQVAYGLMISQDTADKLTQLEEQQENSESHPIEVSTKAKNTQNPKLEKQKKKGFFGWIGNAAEKVWNLGKGSVTTIKTIGEAMIHPAESGKKVLSNMYAILLKILLHVVSWIAAVCIILMLFLQYAIGAVVRMFLPLGFACLCVPALVNKGMTLVLVTINISCWPIGFAIIQNMIGSLSMDTQLAAVLAGALDKGMEFNFMVQSCGVLAISLLSIFGYLAVPAAVGMFVGVNVGTGIAGKVSSFLSSAAGAAAGMTIGGAMGMAGMSMGSGMTGAGNMMGRGVKNMFSGRQKTPEELQASVQAMRSASAKREAEGYK